MPDAVKTEYPHAVLLGRQIRQRRKARRETLASLSRRAGITLGYLSHIELGKYVPTLNTLHPLAAALDTTPAVLLFDTELAARALAAPAYEGAG